MNTRDKLEMILNHIKNSGKDVYGYMIMSDRSYKKIKQDGEASIFSNIFLDPNLMIYQYGTNNLKTDILTNYGYPIMVYVRPKDIARVVINYDHYGSFKNNLMIQVTHICFINDMNDEHLKSVMKYVNELNNSHRE